jgi:hypothetical protein
MALTKLNNQTIANLTDFNLSADDMPSGSVVQVQTSVVTSAQDSSGTAWTNIMSVTITPQLPNSKIFLLCNPASMYPGLGGVNDDYYSCRMVRNGSTLSGMNTNFHAEMGRAEAYGVRQYPVLSFVDSPASTAPLTYTLQFQRTRGSGALRINDTGGTSTFHAFEITG